MYVGDMKATYKNRYSFGPEITVASGGIVAESQEFAMAALRTGLTTKTVVVPVHPKTVKITAVSRFSFESIQLRADI